MAAGAWLSFFGGMPNLTFPDLSAHFISAVASSGWRSSRLGLFGLCPELRYPPQDRTIVFCVSEIPRRNRSRFSGHVGAPTGTWHRRAGLSMIPQGDARRPRRHSLTSACLNRELHNQNRPRPRQRAPLSSAMWFYFVGYPIADCVLCHFKIIVRLEVDPESRAHSEISC